MTKHGRTRIAVLTLVLCCVTPSAQAAKPEADGAERAKVQQVLQSETATGADVVNRREALQPTLRPATNSDPTWWQSGYVKVGDDWRSVEQSTVSSVDVGLLNEYRQQRAVAPKTADGQFALANWCRSHKLVDQEQVHLTQFVQMSEPGRDLTPAYERLGYRQTGYQQWIMPQDLEDAAQEGREVETSLKRWLPEMKSIARKLHGNAKGQQLALTELAKIRDPASIPAMLVGLGFESESGGRAMIGALATMEHFESTKTLSRLAVLAPWPKVREEAVQALNSRRLDDYVPELLSLVATPIRFDSTSFEIGRGGIAYKFVWSSESESKLNVRRLVVIDWRKADRWSYIWSKYKPSINGWHRFEPSARDQRRATDVSRQTADHIHELEVQAEQQGQIVDELNSRVGKVLNLYADQPLGSEPTEWWAWWNDYSGMTPPEKQVVVVEEKAQIGPPPPPRKIQRSCLIAGTPIWTDRGFIAIETIAAGDRVLAKNIETGELAYKPVVHTTVRQPVPVKKFVVNGQPIVASAGHNFWVSGSGWTKTRELIPQQPIHTVVGMARVESVEDEAVPAPVYNLVVADFHTYFVGPAMLLSHDVLPPRPTNVKVPGLAMK